MGTRPPLSLGPALAVYLPGADSAAARCLQPLRLARPVRGALFDLAGVLYDDTAWRRWLLRLLAQIGLHTQYRSFFRVWDREHLRAVQRGAESFCEAFRKFLRAAGLSEAQIDEVQAACQARRRDAENDIRALPGVKTALTRLRQMGLTLAVLANCEHPAATLESRLERIGLGNLFSIVISSFDLRQTKPDAGAYQAALAAFDLPAADVAYVGHDAEDLRGASAVGMPTVAIHFDPDTCADVFLARIEELTDVLVPYSPLAATG